MKILSSLKPVTRFSKGKFFAVFLVLIIAQIVDAIIGNLADIFRNFSISFWGVAVFTLIAAIYCFGQYFILEMVKGRNKEQKINRTHFNLLEKVVTVIQYILTAIMVFLVLQTIFASKYYTAELNIGVILSGGLAIYLMSLFAYWLLSWFRTRRALILLLYGLAMAMTAISVVGMVVQFSAILLEKPQVVTPISEVVFGAGPPLQQLANTVQSDSGIASFILIWAGTILLLRHNIHRIGKVKFWALLSTPIIIFSTSYLSLYQSSGWFNPTAAVVMPLLLIIFSGIAAATLIGFAFRSVAKPLIDITLIKDYMIITAYAFILFFATTLTSIGGVGYPPFGIVNVFLVGPFSFLILNGLYRSAISVAEDVNLRKSLRNTTEKELKLLDDIGTAQMNQEIERKVTQMTKANAALLTEQSGIEPSLTDGEIQDYLVHVTKEIQETITRGKKI